MPPMLHFWSAMLHPDDGQFAAATRNVPNRPLDVDGPKARTQCTEFARVRGKLLKDEVQRERQVRFKLDVRSGGHDLSPICRVGTHALLKQLSKPEPTTVVPRELAKTVKTSDPSYQLCPVIFDGRRVRLLYRCFDRRQQISNSMIELGEQKSHAASAWIELRRLPSHFLSAMTLWICPNTAPYSRPTAAIGRLVNGKMALTGWPVLSDDDGFTRPLHGSARLLAKPMMLRPTRGSRRTAAI
jgi:hypothetical protein